MPLADLAANALPLRPTLRPMDATLACPSCKAEMRSGWLGMWNVLLGGKVRWQSQRPGYARLRVPSDARVVLKVKARARDARIAWRCPSCSTMVVPGDAAYDR